MADAYVQVAPDSTGKRVDTSEITVSGATVERQRIALADQATAAAVAAIINTLPTAAAYGLVTRGVTANYVDTANENAGNANVAGSATFNGATHDLTDLSAGGPGFSRFRVFCYADQAGTLNVQQSKDGSTWRTTITQATAISTGIVAESLVTRRYIRAQFVNGVTGTTVFEFETALVAV